jgi:hypothetical protein
LSKHKEMGYIINEGERRVLDSFTIQQKNKEALQKHCKLKDLSKSRIVDSLIEAYLINEENE